MRVRETVLRHVGIPVLKKSVVERIRSLCYVEFRVAVDESRGQDRAGATTATFEPAQSVDEVKACLAWHDEDAAPS